MEENMAKITDTEITAYIEENLLPLHAKKLKKLSKLTLKEILERKSPYLFKAKHVTTASEFMQSVLGAFLSSQEETQFGGFLERLAIFICAKVYSCLLYTYDADDDLLCVDLGG